MPKIVTRSIGAHNTFDAVLFGELCMLSLIIYTFIGSDDNLRDDQSTRERS
jgi:hypothetical protein